MSSGGGFYAIVPVGGAGTRLWPLSRADRPKFLLELLGQGRSLLQTTIDRMAPMVDGICVVTGTAHAAAVARQLPQLSDGDLFVEPAPRESAAAIGLAAAVLARRHPDCVVGSFAADHVVQDGATFQRVVAEAVATAREGYLVTVGITPSHPATGFGYVCSGDLLDVPDAPSALVPFAHATARSSSCDTSSWWSRRPGHSNAAAQNRHLYGRSAGPSSSAPNRIVTAPVVSPNWSASTGRKSIWNPV